MEEWSPSPTCSKSMITLVEAESSSVSRETLSAVARRHRRGGAGSAAAPSTPAGSVVSSTPAVPMLLYLVGDVSAVAGPMPMGVSTKSIESVLGWVGVESSSISAAEPRVLLVRMDRPLLLLRVLSI